MRGAIKAVVDVSKGSDGSGLYDKAEKIKDASCVYVIADILVLEDLDCCLVIHDAYQNVDGNVNVILDSLKEKDADYVELKDYFTPFTRIDKYRQTHEISRLSEGKCTGAVIIKRQHLITVNNNKSVKKLLTTFKED